MRVGGGPAGRCASETGTPRGGRAEPARDTLRGREGSRWRRKILTAWVSGSRGFGNRSRSGAGGRWTGSSTPPRRCSPTGGPGPSPSRTSVGAFYSRFDSKEDAVSYVRERAWEESRRLWGEFLAPGAWEDVPTPALIAEVVRRFCRVLLAGKRPTRAFYLDLLRKEDEEGLARVRSLDRDVAALMARLVEERGVPARGPGSAKGRVAEEGFLRVISGLRDHLLLGPRGHERALILSLARMYATLLQVEPPTSYRELLAMCADARRRRSPVPPLGD